MGIFASSQIELRPRTGKRPPYLRKARKGHPVLWLTAFAVIALTAATTYSNAGGLADARLAAKWVGDSVTDIFDGDA